MATKCPSCGADNPDDGTDCLKCGTTLSQTSSEIRSLGLSVKKSGGRPILLTVVITLVIVVTVILVAFVHSFTSARFNLVASAETEKGVNSPGEPFNITIRLWNLSNQTVSLKFGNSFQAAYVVRDLNGRELFNLWTHIVVPQVITTLTLRAGDYHQYNYTGNLAWTQVDDGGHTVKIPGTYVIVPMLSLMDRVALMLAPAIVTISPN